jgi:hypothetical protein
MERSVGPTDAPETRWHCPDDGTVMEPRGRRAGRCPTCRREFVDVSAPNGRSPSRPPVWLRVLQNDEGTGPYRVEAYYGRTGRDLLGTDAPSECAYPGEKCGLHGHTGLPFFRRCVWPAKCSEPAVACVWWDSRMAGYYEAPVCATHLPLAEEQNLLVPMGWGVVRDANGTWILVDSAQFTDA